ncbi:MAG: putative transposase, partial [Gemmatimonadales bacterium]
RRRHRPSRRLVRRAGPDPQGDGAGDASTQGDGAGEGEEGVGEVGAEGPAALARLEGGARESAYAGAMLLYGFLERAGAGAILASLRSGAARRYDAPAVMLAATLGFALGSSSAEGLKHLLSADAGAVVGLERFPHLRTLRPRLAALADAVDPLGLQVALAKAMLDADEVAPEVFFVDDHFVAYTGTAPVAKGWNTRRRHAEAGRDDTLIVDHAWRAICFASGPPSGLSVTMLGPLEQLRAVVGDRRVMIGFDRGGAYPKLFAELGARGYGWVTYRRAPLARVTATPTRSWANVGGARRYLNVVDETVTLDGVGPVRQISIFEDSRVVLQILTSDASTPAAAVAARLRDRWCIENCFKYLEDHHGIHWLCDYSMNLAADTAKIANPARAAAKAAVHAAEATVAEIEAAFATTATTRSDNLAATNRDLATLTARLDDARADLAAARIALKPIPARLPANQLDPGATRATPRTNRRALQMVCRLLAYNAELDLARSLNTHLDDPDEYRAITRHLLHQPGTITYTASTITVTLRPPDAPRITRALQGVIDQLNTSPPHLTGDRRPITYQIGPRP